MKLLVCLVSVNCMLVEAAENNAGQAAYTVHEWGTFTSIAGADGLALDWQPFGGPSDLPCFVHRFQIGYKASLAGKVRMETPVIYFYAPRPLNARVHVAFPDGYITEWYPAATQIARALGSGSYPASGNVSRFGSRQPRPGEPDSIEWPSVNIDPGAAPKYPFEFQSSHYYAARSTDSAPLTAGGEKEKFLFYRGVGEFQPPISVENISGDILRLKNLSKDRIPAVIVFQNINGRAGYRSLGALDVEVRTAIPNSDNSIDSLKGDLEKILTQAGLFAREARAMVETWRDSWFEEGARVFYIVPAREMETILPLQIEPRPDRVARVFVGRVEVITAEMRDAIRTAIDRNDRATLEKYGRFLQPITREFPGNARATSQMRQIFAKYLSIESACATGAKEW